MTHTTATPWVSPHNPEPPVLIFRSKSGRTEIARHADRTMTVHVLTGKDRLDADDTGRLRRALNEHRSST